MRIYKLNLRVGLEDKDFIFKDGFNHVFSMKNSVGKTTLLRSLLFGLGFNIPDTKGIPFDENVTVSLVIEKDQSVIELIRVKEYISVVKDGKRTEFSLPSEQLDLHEFVLGIKDVNILNNILGVIYIDQDKGWTLLNRGKVIGNNKFNIERFVSGLAGSTETIKLIDRRTQLESQIEKYTEIFEIAKYKDELHNEMKDYRFDTTVEEFVAEKDNLVYKTNNLKKRLNDLKNVIYENDSFVNFIDDMKLSILINNEPVQITKNNIDGYNEYVDILKLREMKLSKEISTNQSKIKDLNEKIEEIVGSFNIEEELRRYQSSVSKLEFDQVELEKIISSLRMEKRSINKEIKRYLNENNHVTSNLSKYILEYVDYLGINEYVDNNKTLFTSELSSLSGRILSQMVFSYKLAYIKELKLITGFTVPIIIDSPRNNEITEENANKMFELLARDFSDHQIIVSSVFEFSNFHMNKIPLYNYLMEKED